MNAPPEDAASVLEQFVQDYHDNNVGGHSRQSALPQHPTTITTSPPTLSPIPRTSPPITSTPSPTLRHHPRLAQENLGAASSRRASHCSSHGGDKRASTGRFLRRDDGPTKADKVLADGLDVAAGISDEVNHIYEEIRAKDMQMQNLELPRIKREHQLQKWMVTNGVNTPHPKEDAYNQVIADCFAKEKVLQDEKCALALRAEQLIDRLAKRLDVNLEGLKASGQFPSDWDGPSTLRPTPNATNTSASSSSFPSLPLQSTSGNIGTSGGAPNIANAAQARLAQNTSANRLSLGGAVQPPASLPRSQRESSSEATKRRRPNPSLGALVQPSSSLRQSSLGPGTPKANTPGPNPTISRAGSAQPPRVPTAANPKKGPPPPAASTSHPTKKSGRSRTDGPKSRNRRRQLARERTTPSTNASADSGGSGGSDSEGGAGRRATQQLPGQHDGADEDEGDDQTLYCMCQKVSFGDMVGCDNDDCELQWFHYKCVGVTEVPKGEWLCPVCRDLPRSGLKISKE